MSKKYTSVGPYGGQGGQPWNDGTCSGVRQLVICAGSVVDSIQIEYDKNGCSIWSKKHGESNGGDKNVVKLNYPAEYLISISGYYGVECNHVVVQSLTLQTNKQKYGPYGRKQSTPFSFPEIKGKIVGFHGRSGLYLDSLGAYYEPCLLLSSGPFGGLGGHSWDDGTNYSTVRNLVINYGDVLDSIQIEYDNNGRSKWSEKHGESKGGKRNMVKIDYPNEFIISVSGYLTEDSSCAVVKSLTLETNKKKYGPYGTEQGKYFSTSSTSGKIVGFHGRCGLFLDSIGAYLEPFQTPIQVVSEGPSGGCGGCKWDDGIYTTVRQLIIYSGSAIDSIQIEYDKNGRSQWSQKHGESKGGDKNVVTLNYPGEFIVSITGSYSCECGLDVVRSLKIETNKRVYGPFGKERGKTFKFPKDSGRKIIGFHGRAGLYLDSIGVHSLPILDPTNVMSIGPFGGNGGFPWNDGAYTTIRQLIICNGDVIDSIQIEYDKKGQSTWSQKHGKSNGGNKNIVKLDYPGEFLISMSGHYNVYFGVVVVQSLAIESNKKTYGPFGNEKGTPFNFPTTSGKIIGFHGRSGEWLDSIGAYYEPFPSS